MRNKSLLYLVSFLSLFVINVQAQQASVEIARIKYRGGGDWYNDPSALRNVIRYANEHLPILLNQRYVDVELGSTELFNYPFAFLTGHGIIEANEPEIENLRTYLNNGGFLYADDDYGLDISFRELMKRVFPNEKLIELPFNHTLYKVPYSFPNGVPKVHEHDGKAPQGFALFKEGKMVVYYTYESNPSDGWADPEIHDTPKTIRDRALQFGVNLLYFALSQVN
jgi:hypothetical protein